MDNQYSLSGIHNYRPHFPTIQPIEDPFQRHYEMVLHNAASEQAPPPPPPLGFGSYRSDSVTGGFSSSGGVAAAAVDRGAGRWPRQETLTLLEIRTRLDSRFKEANQKGPLWDEVSRIMSDEHGYQRSGKKCREKFENLYKYYKKTKEGKAGRQDGKNYRFFRQLEALYGDHANQVSNSHETEPMGYNFDFHYVSNTTDAQGNQDPLHGPKLCDSLSLCSSAEFDTSSSDDRAVDGVGSMDTGSTGKKQKRRGRRSWKTKIKDFIDSQMRKVMERQEEWLEKTTKTLERKEQEKTMREEECRKQEAERVEKEHKFWENERAWIEVRDAAFMEALHKISGKGVELGVENGSGTIPYSWNGDSSSWGENEISRLIQLRANMDYKFQEGGCSEEAVWEKLSGKMACMGYYRRGLVCKEKWESLQNYVKRTNEGYKKRNEDPRSCYYMNRGLVYNHGEGSYSDVNDQGFDGRSVSDGGFRFMLGNDGDNSWENYGVKLGKGPRC